MFRVCGTLTPRRKNARMFRGPRFGVRQSVAARSTTGVHNLSRVSPKCDPLRKHASSTKAARSHRGNDWPSSCNSAGSKHGREALADTSGGLSRVWPVEPGLLEHSHADVLDISGTGGDGSGGGTVARLPMSLGASAPNWKIAPYQGPLSRPSTASIMPSSGRKAAKTCHAWRGCQQRTAPSRR